jgi:hypothetical protein
MLPTESAAKPATKPVIFVSHAHADGPLVTALKAVLDDVFAGGVECFATVIPGAIEPGKDWFGEIRDTLAKAKVVLFLVTPASIGRPWLWFEMGAAWEKYQAKQLTVLPVCVNIPVGNLPPPLSAVQSLSLTEESDVKLLLTTLRDRFGFGKFTTKTVKSLIKRVKGLPGVQTASKPGETIEQYQERLAGALERLIAQKALAADDVSVFSVFDLLPLTSIRKLRRTAEAKGDA